MGTLALPAATNARSSSEIYRARYIIAFAVTLASVLELVDTSIVNVALPHMMGNLGATLDEVAWVSTGYIVANVIILPITSFLSDTFGRRNYYTGSIALFTLASVFCGHATTLESLVFWRIVQGIGGGALIATAQAILFDVFPLAERGTATAIFGMGVMVGPAIGPTLGGWITDNYSWPWIFYINIPLGLLAGWMTWRYVPEPSVASNRKGGMDWLGLALLIIGIGSLQLVLERGETKDWFESREIILEALFACAGLIGFVWHELTTAYPIVDLRVLKNRQLGVGVLFASLLGFALYASVFALPVFLQNVLGYSAWDTGRVILPGAIVTAFTMALMGRLSGKVDARALVAIGVLLFMWSMWLHFRLTSDIGTQDLFWPVILRGIGLGFVFIPLTGAAVAELKPTQMAQGTGLFNLSRQLGGSFGIAISATLITRFTEQSRDGLRAHLTSANTTSLAWMDRMTTSMSMTSGSLQAAQLKANQVLELMVRKQASVLAFEKVFLVMGITFVCALPLLLLFRTGKARAGVEAH